VHLAHPLGVKAFSHHRSRTIWTLGTWPTCCEWARLPKAWIAPAAGASVSRPGFEQRVIASVSGTARVAADLRPEKYVHY
jgi:hypothetical protein